MEEIMARKKEYRMTENEMFSTWMYNETSKRKGIEAFQIQQLREVVEKGGADILTNFRDKYKALRIDGERKEVVDTYYMEKMSAVRQQYQTRIRRDPSGRDYYENRKGRNIKRKGVL